MFDVQGSNQSKKMLFVLCCLFSIGTTIDSVIIYDSARYYRYLLFPTILVNQFNKAALKKATLMGRFFVTLSDNQITALDKTASHQRYNHRCLGSRLRPYL